VSFRVLSPELLELWPPLDSVTHSLRNASQAEQQTVDAENWTAAAVRDNCVSGVLF